MHGVPQVVTPGRHFIGISTGPVHVSQYVTKPLFRRKSVGNSFIVITNLLEGGGGRLKVAEINVLFVDRPNEKRDIFAWQTLLLQLGPLTMIYFAPTFTEKGMDNVPIATIIRVLDREVACCFCC
jgi:hypothetical protein